MTIMKKVILTPNPYRDTNFNTVREAVSILKEAGMDVRVCLPFEVEREREFAPIKNMTGVDSVETARILLEKNGVVL